MELDFQTGALLLLVAAVVAFFVFVQGLTIAPLLRKMREIPS